MRKFPVILTVHRLGARAGPGAGGGSWPGDGLHLLHAAVQAGEAVVELRLDLLEAVQPAQHLLVAGYEGGDSLLVFTLLQSLKQTLDVAELQQRVLEVKARGEQGGVDISQGQQLLGVNKSVSLLCWREAGGK